MLNGRHPIFLSKAWRIQSSLTLLFLMFQINPSPNSLDSAGYIQELWFFFNQALSSKLLFSLPGYEATSALPFQFPSFLSADSFTEARMILFHNSEIRACRYTVLCQHCLLCPAFHLLCSADGSKPASSSVKHSKPWACVTTWLFSQMSAWLCFSLSFKAFAQKSLSKIPLWSCNNIKFLSVSDPALILCQWFWIYSSVYCFVSSFCTIKADLSY